MANLLIVSDPNIMMGKPVVAGTRITVELVLEHLAAGESIEQLLDSYPHLTRAGVQAALLYAAQLARWQAGFPSPIDPDLEEDDIAEYPLTQPSAASQTMLASEAVLSRDWLLPEEDEAWADL